AGGARSRPRAVRHGAHRRARGGRHAGSRHDCLPCGSAPRRDRALPALRLRRVRVVRLAGGQRGNAEPAGPGVRVRDGVRPWWLDGRRARKRNTFTDFIAAADMLADRGWVAPDRIVSRGLSAGGLLQGAVFSMAPRRWRAVVAEVPFVDCVTTMLDPGIPLTIGEWDEWGDPRDPAIRAFMDSSSPQGNAPAGPRPDLPVPGSLQDPGVLIHDPGKWVARLRATDTAGPGSPGSRLLFRPELGSGAHVGPAGRYDRLRYEAEILAFIVDAAGGEAQFPPGLRVSPTRFKILFFPAKRGLPGPSAPSLPPPAPLSFSPPPPFLL